MRGGENSGTAHEIEETGFEAGERGREGSESSGKEGENMGQSEMRQLPCLKMEKEREKCKICPI